MALKPLRVRQAEADRRLLEAIKTLGREVRCTELAALVGMTKQEVRPALKRLVMQGSVLVRQEVVLRPRYRRVELWFYRWAGELSEDLPSWFPKRMEEPETRPRAG